MDNLVKIRNIVEELTIRDEKLIERSKILEELFLKSPQAIAIMERDWKYVLVNLNVLPKWWVNVTMSYLNLSRRDLLMKLIKV